MSSLPIYWFFILFLLLFSYFLSLFLILGTFQSILAIIQFASQKSVGLYKLGELHLNVLDLGLAKLILNSHTYLRPYGTFPHPNPLSAFLLVTLFLNLYFLFI